MNYKYLIGLIICSLVLMKTSKAAIPSPTAVYTNKLILVEPDAYILYWNYTDQVQNYLLKKKN